MRLLLDNLKNTAGWRSAEQLVVIAVDDYGNVRLDSAAARERLDAAGLELSNRFDRFDALETRQDLEATFEVLSSVSDGRGRSAVMTPYVLSANPDFAVIGEKRDGYYFESLPLTFERLSEAQPAAYDGAWMLWKEGIRNRLLRPQFHGREHVNVNLLERKLKAADKGLIVNLENKSLAALSGESSMPGVGFTHAFGLWDKAEIDRHREIIESGLTLFEEIFGYAPKTFTPPAQQLHPDLYPFVESLGVRAIDKPLRCVRRLDKDLTSREWNTLGVKRRQGHVSVVRNVVFEPTRDREVDSVQLALNQVAAAFRWGKPAIISSHRVNFCGHIDPGNREYGLAALKRLLDGIARRWSDVQFVSADELIDKILVSHDRVA